jgi:hypothetical protein
LRKKREQNEFDRFDMAAKAPLRGRGRELLEMVAAARSAATKVLGGKNPRSSANPTGGKPTTTS